MPDITMCINTTCPKRESCYRAMAKPDWYQSYSAFEPICNEYNNFPYFMGFLKGGDDD